MLMRPRSLRECGLLPAPLQVLDRHSQDAARLHQDTAMAARVRAKGATQRSPLRRRAGKRRRRPSAATRRRELRGGCCLARPPHLHDAEALRMRAVMPRDRQQRAGSGAPVLVVIDVLGIASGGRAAPAPTIPIARRLSPSPIGVQLLEGQSPPAKPMLVSLRGRARGRSSRCWWTSR